MSREYPDRHHTPMWTDPNAVHFVDRRGVSWRVVERATDRTPGAREAHCLIFLCEGVVRRAWTYPQDWRHLTPTELEALTETG